MPDTKTYSYPNLPSPHRYNGNIGFNFCGTSGLQLPQLSLGLWHSFGDVDNQNEAAKMLRYAFDSGITHFDLANNYGVPPGSAETNFGEFLKKNWLAYRDELIISSKAGHEMWPGPYGDGGSRKYLMASINQSLKRLGLEYVDIFYSHRYDPHTPLEETMGALSDIVRQGKALYVGISKYPQDKAREAYAILKANGTPCLLYQGRYNIFAREAEQEVFPATVENGIGFIGFSPLAQGTLSNKYMHGIPENSRAALAHGFLKQTAITPALVKRILKLNNMALERGQTLAQMALAWCFHQSALNSVIVGTSTVKQLQENIDALKNLHFTDDELWRIGEI